MCGQGLAAHLEGGGPRGPPRLLLSTGIGSRTMSRVHFWDWCWAAGGVSRKPRWLAGCPVLEGPCVSPSSRGMGWLPGRRSGRLMGKASLGRGQIPANRAASQAPAGLLQPGWAAAERQSALSERRVLSAAADQKSTKKGGVGPRHKDIRSPSQLCERGHLQALQATVGEQSSVQCCGQTVCPGGLPCLPPPVWVRPRGLRGSPKG